MVKKKKNEILPVVLYFKPVRLKIMNLQIVVFNKHRTIDKCLLLFFYMMLVVLCIMPGTNYFFWVLLVVILLIGLLHRLSYEVYTPIGICSISLRSVQLEYTGRLDIIEFSEIIFIYGGYKGKDNSFFEILTGEREKIGVNNYLILKNDTSIKVQIMLNSKKEYQQLLDKLTELETSGIKIQKTHYAFFEFRNILTKIMN